MATLRSMDTHPASLRRLVLHALVVLTMLLIIAACSGSDSGGASSTSSDDETTTADGTGADPSTSDSADDGSSAIDGAVEVGGGDITVVDFAASADAATNDGVVLFLHGAAFTSQTWVTNGILEAVAAAGHRALAIDLPGSGSSDDVDLDDEEFLASLFDALDLDPASTVIVSPSMSGIFSLPALRDPFFADLAGYVPVAPSGAGSFADDGPPVGVPALLVWGDGDGSDPRGAADRLAEGFVDAEVLIISDAGHTAYQQQPKAFTDALLAFADARALG